MGIFHRRSIRTNLILLVLLAVLPALLILLETGMEQRRASVEYAQNRVRLLAHTMAEVQRDVTTSARQIITTLALLPEVVNLDLPSCGVIFRSVLAQHPHYWNIALTDVDGLVLVSGKSGRGPSLKDRKHFREAVASRAFAAGEYITTRVGSSEPAFPFAAPVFDRAGKVIAVIATTVRLAHYASFHDVADLPENSFVAVTDHRGIRLFYYPAREKTNAVGKPIRAAVWERVRSAEGPGIFTDLGSDGVRRIFAFEPLRLSPHSPPYLYVWAGLPEDWVLSDANATLRRNLLLLCLAGAAALAVSWLVGGRTLLTPIAKLVALTREYAGGNLEARSEQTELLNEFGTLTAAFHDMAAALAQGQRTLRDNEARFRLLTDSLDALVYVADMDTHEILFINEHGKSLFGDVTGAVCWQTLQPGQTGPCPFCTNEHLLLDDGSPGEVYTWEYQNTTDGRYYFVQDRAIYWVDGRIVRLEVATDISERRLAETRLAEESERLAVTLRSIGEGVITADTEGRVVLVNAVAEDLIGWKAGEAAGRPLVEVFRCVDEATRQPCGLSVDDPLDPATDGYRSRRGVLVARGGTERTIAETLAPIRNRQGGILGAVLVFRDISEQLRTQEELLKVKKLESIGVLAGGIAHDFNNILTAVGGNLDLALYDPDLTPRTRALLEGAQKAAFRAQGLTRQLLTFAKGGAPVKETASLAEIVGDSAEFVLRGGTVACRYCFAEDLWLVDIDRGQISQVVQNIVLNAAQAMPTGGTINIACENVAAGTGEGLPLSPDKPYAKLSVSDSGSGIAADIRDRIFDPYFSTRPEGSGLGLAITHSIVDKHGGHIAVVSTEGRGTTFTVYLPASQQETAPSGKREVKAPEIPKGKILVMDDDDQVRSVCAAMLEELGHEAMPAADGAEAVSLYRREAERGAPFDLVLMDLTIPGGMGGREAAKEIHAFAPDARLVVTSGYSSDPVMADFKAHGFCAALVKPFRFGKLQNVLARSMA